MVAAVPAPIRSLIQHESELGYSVDAVAAGPYGVSLRTLQRMRKTWRLYGTMCIPSENKSGRPRSISELYEHQLVEYLGQRPMAYLDEMAYFLLDEYGLVVDEATVWRSLRRLGWSRKIQRKVARERNQTLRNAWFVKQGGRRADQLIFLDESAACERTSELFQNSSFCDICLADFTSWQEVWMGSDRCHTVNHTKSS